MFWDNWLMSAPRCVIWGAVIILLLLTYALCTISFAGSRTRRTAGSSHRLYRFTKHPAYITKNLSY